MIKITRKYGRYIITAVLFQLLLSALVIGLMVAHKKFPSEANGVFSAWDARHYQFLADHGYQVSGEDAKLVVFFPLYPMLIRLAKIITNSTIYASLLVTAFFSVLAHVLFFIIVNRLFTQKRSKIIALALFFLSPLNVYFFSGYTESLFLFLALLFFILLDEKKYFYACIVGFFASLTRLFGVLFVIPFVLEIIRCRKLNLFSHLTKALVIVLGFFIYLNINSFLFGDPLYFSSIQKQFWYKFPVNPVTNYLYIVKTSLVDKSFVTRSVDNIAIATIPVIFLLYLFVRWHAIRFSWLLWLVANYLVVVAQSFSLSSGRYLLILFPLYLMIAEILGSSRYLSLFGIPVVILFAYLSWVGVNIYSYGGWLY